MFKEKCGKFSIPLVALLALGGLAFAQAVDGAEVMDRYYHVAKPKTQIMAMTMSISKGGSTLTRSMTTWTTGDNAKGEVEQKVIKFSAPGDIRGSGFLTAKKVDGSKESQLWLPAMGRVRRLSSGASDQDSAFFGSDFSNRDIGGFIESDFGYSFLKEEDGLQSVAALPKRNDLGYEKVVYFIDPRTSMAQRIDYYKGGKLLKTQELAYVQVGPYLVPSKNVMKSASGSVTEIVIGDEKVDQEFGDIFNERFLKK
jgi:hypothetical protein